MGVAGWYVSEYLLWLVSTTLIWILIHVVWIQKGWAERKTPVGSATRILAVMIAYYVMIPAAIAWLLWLNARSGNPWSIIWGSGVFVLSTIAFLEGRKRVPF